LTNAAENIFIQIMSKLSVKAENTNYCAKVFVLPELRPHPNADKLALVSIDGQTVITSKTAIPGQKYIYFPLECAINESYLSYSNSFSKPELNKDKTKKGFFSEKCRVKATRLRSVLSEGFIVPLADIIDWAASEGIKVFANDFIDGEFFDTIGDKILCEKYINTEALRKLAQSERNEKNKRGKVKRFNKLVDNQFRFHVDTEQLKRNIYKVNPDDKITISYKLHGSSAIFSKVLAKKKIKWYETIVKKIGINIVETQYDYLWSSRRIVKNQFEEKDKQNQHFYDSDIWSIAAKKVNPALKDGYSVYAELVGQTPTGSWIQNGYAYGTKPCEMEIYVYRVTSTNISGDVIEFSTDQVARFCAKAGLKMVPVFYQGKAKDLFSELNVNEHWHENFLEKLKEKYTEKDCYMNEKGTPEEGIILSIDGDFFNAFKLKSLRFLERESVELDRGEVDMETQESVEEAKK
jgi:hypothetical protein